MTDVVELLRDLIRFDTTNPPGNEGACIAYVKQLLDDAGVESRVFARDDARPNLIARLPGAGDAPPLLLYGHVDVVQTAGQQWTHPPFGAELVDGVVWGRGALDMKGGVAMLVDAFLRAARGELKPRGDLILAVLSDEENGGDFGAKYLVDEHADLFEGVRHSLGEFGGATVHLGGKRFYPIQVAEKQICWMRGRVRGPGGHGALGVRGSALAKLGKILHTLDKRGLPVHVTPVTRAWLEGMAAELPRPQALLLRSLLEPRLAEATLRVVHVEQLRLIERALRNTVSVTIVHAGSKINVIPAEVELELDGRTLPGFGPDDLDLTWLEGLGAILRELDPGAIPVPMLQVGVTDGRFFSRIGIQTYGFLPLELPAGFEFTKLIHAADERVPAAAVRFGAEAVGRAVERYAG